MVTEIPTPTAAKLLVCVGPSPAATDLIRAAQGRAKGLQAEWFAVYVEDPRMLRLPEAERNRAVYNLRLAEQLGAETVTLRGRCIAAEIVNFARQRQISKIVLGKPAPLPMASHALRESGGRIGAAQRRHRGAALSGEPGEARRAAPFKSNPSASVGLAMKWVSSILFWPPASPF